MDTITSLTLVYSHSPGMDPGERGGFHEKKKKKKKKIIPHILTGKEVKCEPIDPTFFFFFFPHDCAIADVLRPLFLECLGTLVAMLDCFYPVVCMLCFTRIGGIGC